MMYEHRFARAAWQAVRIRLAVTPWLVAGCGGTATWDGPGGTASGANESPRGASGMSSGDVADAGTTTLVLRASGGPSGDVTAQASVESGGTQGCNVLAATGACQLVSCNGVAVASPAPDSSDLGTLSASAGGTTVVLAYGGAGFFSAQFPPPVALVTGQTMTFHGGNGAAVPAFDVPVVIPGPAILTSPSTTTGTIVDSSQDLSLAFMPIAVGQIHFQLAGPDPTGTSIACTFDGSSGSGVVPRAFLASMKAAGDSFPTYASLHSEIDTTTSSGGLTIVTQSFQDLPAAVREFAVSLQ